MRTKRTLFEEQTPFQLLSVIETDFFGRVMLLDNKIMLTEKDEHIYHEMISPCRWLFVPILPMC
jgi:spermidine synthase